VFWLSFWQIECTSVCAIRFYHRKGYKYILRISERDRLQMSKFSKFFVRMDKWLTNMEARGFHVANTLHRWTINVILMGCGYGVYTIFRDYNQFWKDSRVSDAFFLAHLKCRHLLWQSKLWKRRRTCQRCSSNSHHHEVQEAKRIKIAYVN
jgi:hypothetical protein